MPRNPIAALRRPAARLRKTIVRPEASPSGLVVTVALLPPVVAGLVLFRTQALLMLAVAAVAAIAAHVGVRLLHWPRPVAPGLAALVGVALVGPGASLAWVAVVAVLAAGLEVARARYVAGARLQAGLIAYAVVLLASRGGPAAYLAPDEMGPAAEPIRYWLQVGGQWPVEPVRLYVGNVPGPVFATSLLAVAVGVAWLWYARRLSLLVVLTFLAGAAAAVELAHLPGGINLLSGPLWFVAALVLADRRTLPSSPFGRPLLGAAAGAIALGARTRGFAIESAPVIVAALQVLTAGIQGAGWLNGNRRETRARLRELRESAQALGRLRSPDRTAG